MCSVTIFHHRDQLILTMNRDERRARHESGWHIDDGSMMYPVDGEARGTWVGANYYGVAAALLNRYQDRSVSGKRSRGDIIPQLLAKGGIDCVVTALKTSLPVAEFNPFCLMIAYREQCYIAEYDGNAEGRLLMREPDTNWAFETSSSLNPEFILPYRRRLFAAWLENTGEPDQITDFHLRQDSGMASEAVMMMREPTHSKSLTQFVIDYPHASLDSRYVVDEKLSKLVNHKGVLPTASVEVHSADLIST